MAAKITPGDAVQTPFGKGVVREVRNSGRLLVDVQGRALLIDQREISTPNPAPRRARAPKSPPPPPPDGSSPRRLARSAPAEIDLHGLRVEEAMARVEQALNEAMLADLPELRVVHGRSGGRLRAALHRRLRDIPSVRGFRLDPRNEGVTIVSL